MKKIEVIVSPEKLEKVKEIVEDAGAGGMTVSQVLGCGTQKGHREVYRGTEMMINLLHKIKVEIVIPDSKADGLVDELVKGVQSGRVGDGKIFVFPVEEAIRIRTGEKGDKAL